MITEYLLGKSQGVWLWFAGLFPDWVPPEFLTTADTQINALLARIGGGAIWADWGYIVAVVGVVLSIWAVGFSIKIIRALVAHVPQFGGAG